MPWKQSVVSKYIKVIVFGELATVSNFGTMPVLQAIQVVLDFVEHL